MEESSFRTSSSSNCSTNEISSQKPRLFREMKPRVGNIYQIKVGKFSARRMYESSRPCPEKYSRECPHRMEDVAIHQNKETVEVDSSVSLCLQDQNHLFEEEISHFSLHQGDVESKRNGGTCWYRASTSTSTTHEWLPTSSFSESTQLPLSQKVFCEEMIKRNPNVDFTQMSTKTNPPTEYQNRRKRRATRMSSSISGSEKYQANISVPSIKKEDQPWKSCQLLHQGQSNCTNLRIRDPEAWFHHIATFLHGNIDIAAWDTKVRLSHGTARKARRISTNLRENVLLRSLSATHKFKEMWRSVLEEKLPLWGDLRSSTTKHFTDTLIYNSSTSIVSGKFDREEADHSWKCIWSSILEFGLAMESAASDPTQDRPTFIEVFQFLKQTSQLLTPSEYRRNLINNLDAYNLSKEAINNEELEDIEGRLSMCCSKLVAHMERARDFRAWLLDYVADNEEGVDLDILREALDKSIPNSCPLVLPEELFLDESCRAISDWQTKVDTLLSEVEPNSNKNLSDHIISSEKDYLAFAISLSNEGRSFGIRFRNLVILEQRIEKAQQLERRITCWYQYPEKNTVRSVTTLIREVNRVSLPSILVQKWMQMAQSLEIWIERSHIAIRSRIALSEIENLLLQAETMPLNLNEFTEKLVARRRMASRWLTQLEQVVPGIPKDGMSRLTWMAQVRLTLSLEGGNLWDLCSEGVRIPVELPALKLLQMELDAKNWSLKAEKWIPKSLDSKKGKLEELREHLESAKSLRDRLPSDESNDKELWILDHELELKAIVRAADMWFEEFGPYLEWDNRRNTNHAKEISIDSLRRIVVEGNSIHAQIGNAPQKIARILAQAELWYEKHKDILIRLKDISDQDQIDVKVDTPIIISELTDAILDSEAMLSFDLEEVLSLRREVDRINRWLNRVATAAPIKRSKRVGKSRWSSKASRCTLDELKLLLEEAKTLPILTDSEEQRLRSQISEIRQWQNIAQQRIQIIANVIQSIGDRKAKQNEVHLPSSNEVTPCFEYIQVHDNPHLTNNLPNGLARASLSQENQNNEEESRFDISLLFKSDLDDCDKLLNADRCVSWLKQEAQKLGVMTVEEEILANLEKIVKWFISSIQVLKSPIELYENSVAPKLTALLESGNELRKCCSNDFPLLGLQTCCGQVVQSSWSTIIEQQLRLLENLNVQRDAFLSWSKSVENLISTKEKKLTFDAIDELVAQSRQYPSSTEIVQLIQTVAMRSKHWREKVASYLQSNVRALTIDEAKALADEGDELKLSCSELKDLRNAMRASRMWLNRVRKHNLENGDVSAEELESLLLEHNKLIIPMPEEADNLKQATKGFCLCRRPYVGFMIACDTCNEWYHGSCIGISETQADRFDTYTCVRCGVKRLFDQSVSSVVCVVKKWTSQSDLKKSRQTDFQRHQRKVRKEKKDLEKFEAILCELHSNMKIIKYPDKQLVQSIVDLDKVQQILPLPLNVGENQANTNGKLQTILTPFCSDTALLASLEFQENSNLGQIDIGLSRDSCQLPTVKVADTEVNQNHSIDSPLSNSESQILHDSQSNGKLLDPVHEVESRIQENELAIANCKDRLRILNEIHMERVTVDKLEDSYSEKLKVWCIRVRSSFLVCSNQEDVILGKPLSDGSFSPAMVKLMKESEILGISSLRDVQTVMNAFRSICWTAFAMQKLAKRSTLKDVEDILKFCNAVGLGEEKVGKMLKGMIQKATLWQAKVRKALTPKFGERKPYNLEVLKNLEIAYRNIPFDIPEIACLENVIDDKGQRYCLCGGPSDGSFMLGCDKCDEWFHGRCVGVDKATSSSLQSWHCPRCKGETIDSLSSTITEFQPNDLPLVQNVQNDDWAPCAPTIDQIWPPFKSLESPETVEAFGQECIATPDSCGKFEELDGASTLNNVKNVDNILSADIIFQNMKNVDSCSISDARDKATHFQVLSLPSILSVENNTCVSTTSESFSVVSLGATAIDSTQSIEKCTSEVIGKDRNDMLDELDLCQILPVSQNESISMSIVSSTTALVDDSESAHSEIAHTGTGEPLFPIS